MSKRVTIDSLELELFSDKGIRIEQSKKTFAYTVLLNGTKIRSFKIKSYAVAYARAIRALYNDESVSIITKKKISEMFNTILDLEQFEREGIFDDTGKYEPRITSKPVSSKKSGKG